MKSGPALRLVVTVSESARWHGRSVYHVLLDLFRHKGLEGAIVIRSIAGYSGRGMIHSVDVLDLATDLPVRVEAVDDPERIEAVLPDVYEIVECGLVEVQQTRVVKSLATDAGAAAPFSAEREDMMRLVGKAKRLEIHIGADDEWEGVPLHEAIVKRARHLDVAGATVCRGELGYGAAKRIHKHRAFALSKDDPVIVTVIDTKKKVDELLASVDGMLTGGCLISVMDVTVVKYSHAPPPTADADGS